MYSWKYFKEYPKILIKYIKILFSTYLIFKKREGIKETLFLFNIYLNLSNIIKNLYDKYLYLFNMKKIKNNLINIYLNLHNNIINLFNKYLYLINIIIPKSNYRAFTYII